MDMKQVYLIVHVHGSHGDHRAWSHVLQIVQDTLLQSDNTQSTSVVCHVSVSNEGVKTNDGIAVCGNRLFTEVTAWIDEEMAKCVHDGRQMCDLTINLSFICHSLGGLIARYACGRLFDGDFFSDAGFPFGLRDNPGVWVKPHAFISLSSPHLGARRSANWLRRAIQHAVFRTSLFGHTGIELLLEDTAYAPSIIECLADQSKSFFKALALFKNRVLAGFEPFGDIQVAHTSSLLQTNTLSTSHIAIPSSNWWSLVRVSGLTERQTDLVRRYFPHAEIAGDVSAFDVNNTQAKDGKRFVSSPDGELEFVPECLANLQSLSWSRIELRMNSWLLWWLSHNVLSNPFVARWLASGALIALFSFMFTSFCH